MCAMKLRGSIDVGNDRGPAALLPVCATVDWRRCQSRDIKLTIRGQKADRDVKEIDTELIPALQRHGGSTSHARDRPGLWVFLTKLSVAGQSGDWHCLVDSPASGSSALGLLSF